MSRVVTPLVRGGAEGRHKPSGAKRLTVLQKAAKQALQLSLVFIVPMLASTGVSASPIATDTTVSYFFYGLTLSITSTSPTTLNLAPGESCPLSGAWSASGRDGCNECAVQAYLAGLPGLDEQINLALNVNYPNWQPYSPQGSYSQSFTAPTVAGTYYLGAMTAPNYDFGPVDGVANSLRQVSYIVNAGTATAPEPATLALVTTPSRSLAPSSVPMSPRGNWGSTQTLVPVCPV